MTTRTTAHATFRSVLRTTVLGAATLGVALWTPLPTSLHGLAGGQAFAQSSTHGSGGGSGSGSSHAPGTSGAGMGQGGSSAARGHNGQGGSTGTESGDEGTSPDKKGPRYGGGPNSRKPAAGTTGGRPVWAKEGIPAVELGRLSVARAPEHVLDHAFTEVVSNWSTVGTTVLTLTADGQPTLTMTVAQLYSLPALEFAKIVQTYYSSITRIDSPLENLSLIKNYTLTGTTALTGVKPASSNDLYAIFLGSASDKTIPISTDTVLAVNTILGLPTLTEAQLADIAAKAEAVRVAIDTGHSD
ncbi:MAG: hypothetical protein KGI51_09570 [Rhodospirillales bacterium]|nr:hypothetical protein [Rhodospirillales bacterium]